MPKCPLLLPVVAAIYPPYLRDCDLGESMAHAQYPVRLDWFSHVKRPAGADFIETKEPFGATLKNKHCKIAVL
ncbi:hypothetical protein SAMN02910291_00196 [Desulfovibrio desulfuricans]|uniref:Uncharacterized protein n=3 Tax=Desulfovibrio TaxID=872 RepID=A0AA94HQ89_DESDE|nr:hypothetical protein SAMN02910291_00196 [Desulfovibrio desulfuricans]SPD35696.1 Hypothetical protein DSVG11_1599 [Desulfovibrio sp. G11]